MVHPRCVTRGSLGLVTLSDGSISREDAQWLHERKAGSLDRSPDAKHSGGAENPLVVLVVDDHDDTRDLVAEFLRWRGLMAITARSAADARVLCKGVRVHAVVTDFAMPGGDGLELARWVRSHAEPSPPLVMYTGQADEVVTREIEQLGGRLVRKPAELDQIVELILSAVAAGAANEDRG